MTNPDDYTVFSQNPEKLLQEMEDLAEKLQDYTIRPLPARSQKSTALVRILDSAMQKHWPKIQRDNGLENWLAVPLPADRSRFLSTLQHLLDRLVRERDKDPLTGLANRRTFDRALDLECNRSSRQKVPLSLCILDLDDFKALNDTYGHPCGDEILKAVAQILLAETRQTDVAARLGGEEFGLVLSGTGPARARRLLQRVQDKVREQKIFCQGHEGPIQCTFSAGLAGHRGRADIPAQALYRAADEALYEAKERGKDRLRCAPLLDIPTGRDLTVVEAEEKRFFFSTHGKTE